MGKGNNYSNNLKLLDIINKYANKIVESSFGYVLFNIVDTKIEEFISEIKVENK